MAVHSQRQHHCVSEKEAQFVSPYLTQTSWPAQALKQSSQTVAQAGVTHLLLFHELGMSGRHRDSKRTKIRLKHI